jgi:hypothetical protein
MELTPPLARALIRSLARGTAVPGGAMYIHVGGEQWLAAQRETLAELAEDGHAETKFVRGAYGAGKSHFLSIVQEMARASGWMSSHVECKVDGVQIDRFETLYPNVVSKLSCDELARRRFRAPDEPDIDPCRFLLEQWALEQLKRSGVRPDAAIRPFEAENRLFGRLEETLLRTSLSSDFTRALCAYARAYFAKDGETVSAVVRWLKGGPDVLTFPGEYLVKPSTAANRQAAAVNRVKPIGRGTATEVMRGLLWLVRAAGFKGLVLCIDEVEELAKLGNQKRMDQALQALREYVDHAGGEGGFRYLCLYLAATPEMFEGEKYFPRYDALATRISKVSDEINWRAPVIDIDRTPLGEEELVRMATKISAVYQVGYPDSAQPLNDETLVRKFVKSVLGNRTRTAKPRLLARVIVDHLERSRQRGIVQGAPDVEALVDHAVAAIRKEAES